MQTFVSRVRNFFSPPAAVQAPSVLAQVQQVNPFSVLWRSIDDLAQTIRLAEQDAPAFGTEGLADHARRVGLWKAWRDTMEAAFNSRSMLIDLSETYRLANAPLPELEPHEAERLGLIYVPTDLLAEGDYNAALWQITTIKIALEAVGFTFKTGFIRV